MSEELKTTAGVTRQVYLGPNHPRMILVKSTIFKNGVPEQIEKLLEKCPSAKALLVDSSRVSQVYGEMRHENSAYGTLYRQAEVEFQNNLFIGKEEVAE